MREQKGFSLLETMIAGVVASLGLSGVAALLIAAVSGTATSGHRGAAQALAVQMAETMRLSPDRLAMFLALPPESAPSCGPLDGCDDAQFTATNIRAWHLRVGLALPQGTGVVCRDGSPDDGDSGDPACDGLGAPAVKIFWVEPDGAQSLSLVPGE